MQLYEAADEWHTAVVSAMKTERTRAYCSGQASSSMRAGLCKREPLVTTHAYIMSILLATDGPSL